MRLRVLTRPWAITANATLRSTRKTLILVAQLALCDDGTTLHSLLFTYFHLYLIDVNCIYTLTRNQIEIYVCFWKFSVLINFLVLVVHTWFLLLLQGSALLSHVFKGQLISKELCGILISYKKRMKKFDLFNNKDTSGQFVLVGFL